jgi:hypothetical protein
LLTVLDFLLGAAIAIVLLEYVLACALWLWLFVFGKWGP